MAGKLYLLFQSEEEGSYTFIAEENSQRSNGIPPDAVLIWQVEAESWEIACMKRNDFLHWEPYKPMIAEDADLNAFLPRHKHDLDNFQLLKNLGYPVIRPVLSELMAWVKDMNWPVATAVAPFLVSLGAVLMPYVQEVLDTTDGMWKYWVITAVLDKMPPVEAEVFITMLELLLMRMTDDDRKCEVDVAARDLLMKLGAG